MKENCYDVMFYGCTSLVKAPALPATSLYDYCYPSMFMECTSLKYIPYLPATSLKTYCYVDMFNNCSSLNLSTESDNNYLVLASNSSIDPTKSSGNCGNCYNIFEGTNIGSPIDKTLSYYSTNPTVHSIFAKSGQEKGRVVNNYGYEGEQITVKTVPDKGYKLKAATVKTVKDNEKIECKTTDNNIIFTMVNEDVTVSAEFEVIPDNSVPVSAPVSKSIPTIYIGEDKPEIKVLVSSDTYITESKTFSSIAPIIIEDNRTFLGIRDMAYALGIAPEAIKWDDKTKTASITKSGATISVTQGSKDIKITYGGYIYTKTNDVSAINKNNRIYLPFRVIFELFGYEVNWDESTRTITCK